ncbi:MAG: tetratricopeptide repeat protein, partial [Thermonemataceae bacterium]
MQGFYSFIIFLWALSIGTTTVLQAQKKGKKDAVNDQEDRFKAESHLTEGMKFYILDNYSNALVNFKKALALQPESPGIHYQMAETYIKLKNYDDALDHAEKALALDAENKHCYVLLARLYEKQGKFDKAAEVYERLLETTLTGINPYYYELALIYQYQLKDYKQALKTFEKIEQTFGMSEEVIQQKQQIYIQQGKLELAIQEGTRLTDTDPKNPKYALALAELFIANSQTDQAVVLLEKIARDNPEEYAAHAQANMLMADIYKSQGQGQKAATRIDEMVNDPKVDADAKVKVLIGLMAEANTEALKEEAYQLATQIVDQHPNHVQATAALADILLAQHQLKEARVYYEKALVLDNAQFELWYQVLQIDTQLGEADAMIKHAEEALELFPNQAILWLYSGTGYFEKRDYNTAFEVFELGQSYAISNEMLYNEFSVRLADCYNGLGQFEKADALYGEV